MIYKPQNVYPHNNTIDASLQNTFSFTFNGSHVTCWDYVFYNANSNKITGRAYKNMKSSNIYNQEEARTPISANSFKNGYNYKYKMNIYQENYDIFVMQGTVRNITEITLPNNQIPITYGIDTIREPVYCDIRGERTLIGACYMEIDNGTSVEKRMITGYDPNIKYGADDGYGNFDYRTYVEINVPFSTYPAEGTTYRIYCNYVTSPEYYFQCRKTPIISPVAKLNSWGNIECSSTYYQEQNTDVKSYQYSLYKKEVSRILLDTTVASYEGTELEDFVSLNSIPLESNPETIQDINCYLTVSYTIEDNVSLTDTRPVDHYDFDNKVVYLKDNLSVIPPSGATATIFLGHEILVNQSDTIYNQRLTYEFNDVVRNIDYRIALKVTTQDNMEIENSTSGTFSSISSRKEGDNVDCQIDYETNSIIVDWQLGVLANEIVSREDIVTGDMTRFTPWTYVKRDHLVASGKSYRYHVIPIIQDGDLWKYGDEYITNTVTPEWCYWTIASLESPPKKHAFPDEPNRELFRITDYWKLHIDMEESEFVQNLNNVTHIGCGTKPKITTGTNNYITGSLSCKLSQLEPSAGITDTIHMVEAWRKFISQNSLFLLKNPKGDVLVVGISESPTNSYAYKYQKKLTTISFSFTEVRDIKDIAIL